MITVGGFALTRPVWLLAAAAVIALVVLVRARGGLGDWRRAVDGPLFRALEAIGAVRADEGRPNRLPAVAAAALVTALALSGPAVQRRTADTFRNLDGMLIGFDLSRSVVEGGALPEARIAAMQVASAAGTRQTGLIVYAGDAYVAAAFTSDRGALGQLVAAIGPDVVPEPGSDAARAIALAGQRFAQGAVLAGDLVLATDGGGLDDRAVEAARRLRAEGHRVHVLFVPGPALPDGAPSPDRSAAGALARAGGGIVADVADPSPLAAAVSETTALRLGRSDYAVLGWLDLGRPMLAGAALLLLSGFRRRR